MSTQFQKENFLWLWKRTGLVPPSGLIQEDQKPRSWEQLVDRTVEQMDSDESDPMTELLQKLIQLDDTVARIDQQAFHLFDSLHARKKHDVEDVNQVAIIRLGCDYAEEQLKTIYSIVGQLAAEQEV
jgi:hypothetical protein